MRIVCECFDKDVNVTRSCNWRAPPYPQLWWRCGCWDSVSIQPTWQAKFLLLLADECNGLFSSASMCVWSGQVYLCFQGKKTLHSYNCEQSFICLTPVTFFPRMRFLLREQFNLGHFLFRYHTSGAWVKATFYFSLPFFFYYSFHCSWLCLCWSSKHQKFSLVPFQGICLPRNSVVSNFCSCERILEILTTSLFDWLCDGDEVFLFMDNCHNLSERKPKSYAFWVCHACWNASLLNLW